MQLITSDSGLKHFIMFTSQVMKLMITG